MNTLLIILIIFIIIKKKIENKLSLKKIIIAKIILILINNYIESDLYDEKKDEKDLTKIKVENLMIIKKNTGFFITNKIKLNENDIKLNNINEIYKEVITSLIRNNKLIDYDYSCKIFEELNFESIDFNYQFLSQIFNFLMPDLFMNKDNVINSLEDLFDIKKINYHYVLLKYIFKNSIYIYYIPSLLKTHKVLKELIRSMRISLSDLELYLKNEHKDRIEFIIKKICDSDYYYTMFLNQLNLIKLDEILKYYKDSLSETKKDDIIFLEKIMNKKKYSNECDIYLKDFETAVEENKKRLEKIKYDYMRSKDDMFMHMHFGMDMDPRFMRMHGRGPPLFKFHPKRDFLLDYHLRHNCCNDFDFDIHDDGDFMFEQMNRHHYKHFHHKMYNNINKKNGIKPGK